MDAEKIPFQLKSRLCDPKSRFFSLKNRLSRWKGTFSLFSAHVQWQSKFFSGIYVYFCVVTLFYPSVYMRSDSRFMCDANLTSLKFAIPSLLYICCDSPRCPLCAMTVLLPIHVHVQCQPYSSWKLALSALVQGQRQWHSRAMYNFMYSDRRRPVNMLWRP